MKAQSGQSNDVKFDCSKGKQSDEALLDLLREASITMYRG
jgi:hypothetical protein